MTKRKSLTIPIVWVAAVIGIIQSLVWIGLSVAGVICIKDAYNVTRIEVSDGDATVDKNRFLIFLYTYIVLDTTWLIFSSVLIKGLLSSNPENILKYGNAFWATNAIFVSVVDLVLMGFFANDLMRVHEDEQLKLISMMTVAARGYMLLIINVIIAIILAKASYRMFYKKPITRKPINAFDVGFSRPPWESDSAFAFQDSTSGIENKSFRDDNDGSPNLFKSIPLRPISNIDLSRSNRAYDNNRRPTDSDRQRPINFNQSTLINPFSVNNNQPLVKYNPNPQAERPNNFQRNYIPPTRLNNISPPRPPTFAKDPLIPEPDYSPPGSLKKKSVLRPNSNYIM